MTYVFQMVDGKIESFLAYDMCLKWKMVRWNLFWSNDICVYDMESCNMRRKIEKERSLVDERTLLNIRNTQYSSIL